LSKIVLDKLAETSLSEVVIVCRSRFDLTTSSEK
jgi:hypothetical protein